MYDLPEYTTVGGGKHITSLPADTLNHSITQRKKLRIFLSPEPKPQPSQCPSPSQSSLTQKPKKHPVTIEEAAGK